MSTERLNAPLLRNSLRDNPKDVRGSETDQDSLQASMLIDELLQSTHLCVVQSPKPRGVCCRGVVLVRGYMRLRVERK